MEEFKVRMAKPEDIEGVYNLCVDLCEENQLFSMDPETVTAVLNSCILGQNGVIGVIEGKEGLEGVICLATDRYWYAKDWFLCEVFNFVPVKYRKSTRAKSLLAFAKKCSDDMKIPLVVGIVSNNKTEPKIKLLERQLPKAGAFFVYNECYARA
jgi:hypothetical protein